jgi:hypothetical protein
MVGWLGFCAKIVEFVVSKATGHAMSLSRDQKRTAARALIRFYETLEESSLLVEDLLKVFEVAIENRKPVLFSKDLVPYENRIIRLTEDVKSQYNKLVDAIYIFDPQLASLLATVQGLKVVSLSAFGILLAKARFEIEFDGLHPFKKVSFTTFDDELDKIDIDQVMKAQHVIGEPGKPESISVFPEASNKLVEALSVLLVEDEFTASDFEKVSYLRNRLRNQANLLEKVLPMLREFIASNFTISDVLGHLKRHTVRRYVSL